MNGRSWLGAACLAIGVSVMASVASFASAETPRPGIEQFVGEPAFRSPTISPNGRYVAGILRSGQDDILIVYDRETGKTTPVQRASGEKSLSLDFVRFKGDDRLIFGLVQKYEIVAKSKSRTASRKTTRSMDDFGFVSRVYASDIDGGALISLYDPFEEQRFPSWLSARTENLLASDPDHILIVVPHVGGRELRKVNVRTGEGEAIETGSYDTLGWVLDSNLTPVLREDSVSGGRGSAWLRRGPGESEWTEIARFVGAERANGAPDFAGLGPAEKPGQVVVSARPEGRDTNGLYVYDTATGAYVETLYENDKFDVFLALRDPNTDALIASCFNGYKLECIPRDPQFGAVWAGLVDAAGEENDVVLVSGGDLKGDFMIEVTGPREPGAFYIYDAETRGLSLFQRARPDVDPARMPTQRVFRYTATDGQPLWGYLWLPPGADENTRNLPTIIVPHGGPEARDVWGFDPFAAYWSSQGYAVLQPNFRGGGGFGRAFVEAGWQQWGKRIQQDVRDGTGALVAAGITDPARICIAGWSHGGYVAFTAAFQDGDLYKCSFAGAGISDMNLMLSWVRSTQGGTTAISYKYWSQAMGTDSADLDAHSALPNVEQISMPIFVVHGEIDATVPVEQSDLMIKALKKAGKPFESLIVPGMDHYFRPDQGDDWAEILVAGRDFFQKHIGPGWSPN